MEASHKVVILILLPSEQILLVDDVANTDLVESKKRKKKKKAFSDMNVKLALNPVDIHTQLGQTACLRFISCGLRLSWLFSIEKLKIAS